MNRQIGIKYLTAPPTGGYDAVIVGAGLSGLTVAYFAALSAAAFRVLVLEAGELGPSLHLDASDATNPAFARWCFQSEDPFAVSAVGEFPSWFGVLRKVVGGRGLYWGGVLCRIDPDEFRGDVESISWLARCGFDTGGEGYATLERSLAARHAFLPGGEKLQIEINTTPFTTISRAYSWNLRAVFSPMNFFDLSHSGDSQVHVLPKASVKSIRKYRAKWFLEIGQNKGCSEYVIKADKLVLAAGLIENCRILESWFETGYTYQLTEHLVAGVGCFIPDSMSATHWLTPSLDKLYFWKGSATRGFNLFFSPARRKGGFVLDFWGVGEKDLLSPVQVKCVLGSSVNIDADKSARDRSKEATMLEATYQALGELIAGIGLSKTPALEDSVLETKDAMRTLHYGPMDQAVAVRYVSKLGSVDHEACLSNQQIGIDDIGRVHSHTNLFVAGPSALKRMGSANPNFAALAIATRVGESLSRRR